MITLRFVHRSGCHLCEAMWAELDGVRASGEVDFELIDLAREPHLEARYGESIPLLFHGERELCRYFLDMQKLRDYLDALPGG
ncbi:MAG: glutaredoxin family protein [Gammaproteobacteria bacterium]